MASSDSDNGSVDKMLEELHIQGPPDDWRFNHLLIQVAKEISQDELKAMKYLFTGKGGFGKRLLEETPTALDLFQRLRDRGMLTRDNMISLQACLHCLERIDLVEQVAEFARNEGNTIYFYRASLQPENGYKYIKMHVDGKDFRTCSPNFLQTLKANVAKMLIIPPEFVYIAGVEPSSSLLIIFMVEEAYVGMLLKLLDDSVEFPELRECGVDIVEIDSRSFNITGSEDAELVETEQQSKLCNVYEQLQDKTIQLENVENKVSDLKAEVSRLQGIERCMLSAEKMKGQHKIDTQRLVEAFKDGLQEIDTSTDKHQVKRLLDLNSIFVAHLCNRSNDETLRQAEQTIEQLKLNDFFLKVELLKYKWVTAENIDDLLSEILIKLLENLPPVVQQEQKVELSPEIMKILRSVGGRLSKKERQTLADKYLGNDDDIRKSYEQDKCILLAAMILRRIERERKLIEPIGFIKSCLEEVGREDLCIVLSRQLKQANSGSQATKTPSRPSRKTTTLRKSTARDSSEKSTPGDGSEQSTIEKSSSERSEDKLDVMAKQIADIHKVVTAAAAPPRYESFLGSDMLGSEFNKMPCNIFTSSFDEGTTETK